MTATDLSFGDDTEVATAKVQYDAIATAPKLCRIGHFAADDLLQLAILAELNRAARE
jgi:hypothetical protein